MTAEDIKRNKYFRIEILKVYYFKISMSNHNESISRFTQQACMPTTQLKYKLYFLENLDKTNKQTKKTVASSSEVIVISLCNTLFLIKWVVYNAERRMKEKCGTLLVTGNSKDSRKFNGERKKNLKGE